MSQTEAILQKEFIDGLRDLAFWKINDAVILLSKIDELDSGDIEKLDLTGVSEIKQLKDGCLEIKFYDRLRALELFAEQISKNENSTSQSSFYNALELAAKSARDIDAV